VLRGTNLSTPVQELIVAQDEVSFAALLFSPLARQSPNNDCDGVELSDYNAAWHEAIRA
jgi:hypothetical protein